jgi:3-oxoacyl-[acyl-carrier protein] reductase
VGRFDGQVVIVTGAARGLGRDYARRFAADGAHVVIADIKAADAAAAEASAAGPRSVAVAVDITDRGSTGAMVEQVVGEFGRIDMLVNNAGLWRGLAEAGLLDCPDELWDAAWAVNVTGTLRCYQAVAPVMVAAGYGRIVNVSSIASYGSANSYALTKATVERMTRGMASEMGPHGVTANCIAPGISAFDGAKSNLANADAVLAESTIKRLGTSDDLYAGVAYLCSKEAAWVTGQNLRIDGGNRL